MTATRIFAAPLVLAVVSGIGLIAALVDDGLWDAFSWAALGLPIALVAVLVARGAGWFSAEHRRAPSTNLPRRGRL